MSAPAVPDSPPEQVVLLDEDGTPRGQMAKADVHDADTPLHLGFSCYVFALDGRLLVTQRALSKRSFGGFWTNTVCGHPGPGEAPADAARRRAAHELGLDLHDLVLALPDFRYRAEHAGLVENEVCPVFLARTTGDPTPLPDEVEAWRWSTWVQFREASPAFSPWCQEQLPLLEQSPLLASYARS